MTRVLLVGVVLVFGGELSCILGPDEHIVHIGCHAVLYTGIVLAAVGASLHGAERLRAKRRQSDEEGV